ncbi:hypothetical protein KC345_g8008 [Hortaea werneckii]|nr:hypothetical protein KC345_g8008 [Hortaea werneckii]
MSAEGCAPGDVFHKYCAELSVPRTTWSIEMSKQQLINTLRNRGYRFDLHQSSTDQLLQLLQESDVLYHQVRKDGTDSKGESNTTAETLNPKSKESEQHTRRPGPGASRMQVQPESNISSPRDGREDELVSAEREGEDTFQNGPGRQTEAEDLPTTRPGRGDWREGPAAAKRGRGRSEPADGGRWESDMRQKGKKKMTEKEIDPEFRQRVDTLQSRLLGVAIKSGTHLDTTIKVRRLEGHYFGVHGRMTDVFEDIKKHTRGKWEMMEMKRSLGIKLVPEVVDKMQEAKAEISKIDVLLAQL